MIGEFSNLCGLSKDTLRYYDKAGVLHPSGKAANRYRYYTEYDLMRLMQLRMLQGLDTSLKDCRQTQTLSELSARLDGSIASLDAQITRLTTLRNRIQTLQNEIDTCIQQCGQCQLVRTVATYCIFFTSQGISKEASQTISAWMQHMPYAHTTFCLPNGILPGQAPVPLMGAGILQSYARQNHLPYDNAVSFPEKQAVRCVLRLNDPLHPTNAEFAPLTDYLTVNNLCPVGSWSYRLRFIDHQDKNDKPVYYVGACIRIE